MVNVALPVGELMSRATRAVSTASRRRAEKEAREEVLRELRDFETQLSTR